MPVLAWGIGIDRMALMALGLNDLRDLFSPDIESVRLRRAKNIWRSGMPKIEVNENLFFSLLGRRCDAAELEEMLTGAKAELDEWDVAGQEARPA